MLVKVSECEVDLDIDIINLHVALAEIIAQALKEFRKHDVGSPIEIAPEDSTDNLLKTIGESDG